MLGIRLIRLLDVLPVLSARNAEGVSPRSLVVQAETLQAVEQVLINGLASPSFVVYSETELVVEVPGVMQQAAITDILVLSSQASMTRQSMIEFSLGSRVAAISGTQRLVQTFVRMLLRTPGSNLFSRTLGGGLITNIGRNITTTTQADVALAISRVKQQIVAAQTPYGAIPDGERLLSAEIADYQEDPDNAAVYVTVVLTTHDRQRSAATFVA